MTRAFETVIGLEVHVQLATETKLFCSCPTSYIGKEPNSMVCPVCLGLPGTLPSLNGRAVELGITAALAMGCSINRNSRFHRKNYFYPDLPKAFQISQYDLPLAVCGSIPIFIGGRKKIIGITRLHLEEDAGKLVHGSSDGRLSGTSFSLVDYNRAGIPLAEIVSEPDLSSPEEAREYVLAIRRLVRYLGVSDGDMESGSLRVDANISQKCTDGRWGNRVEIKNLNSVRAMERALEHETVRQRDILTGGGAVKQETRHWDDVAGSTRPTRGKEEAHDYRYFPEPDLPAIVVCDPMVRRLEEGIPELPWAKRERFEMEWGLDPMDSTALSERLDVAEFLEGVVAAGADSGISANWVRTDIMRILKETGLKADELPFTPEALGDLLVKISKGVLSNTAAKDVLEQMYRKGLDVAAAMNAAGVDPGGISEGTLEGVIRKVLEANPVEAGLILSGEDPSGKKKKFLQGLVMREIRGQSPVQDVASMMDKVMGEMKKPNGSSV